MKWFSRRRRTIPVVNVVRAPIPSPSTEQVREAIETGLREGKVVEMDVRTGGPDNRDYTVTVTFRHNSVK